MWPRPAKSRRGVASLADASQDNDDESIRLASLRNHKSVSHGGPRRSLVPFGRSSTLKSGSLQDLKVSPVGGSGGAGLAQQPKPARSVKPELSNQRPRLERQHSSQVSSSSNALNSANAPGHQHQQSRNPFRSSKSMLLLTQNQHIPQATAQLDCFTSKQQAKSINNYQRQQKQNPNWAYANLHQSNSGSDQLHLSQGSNQSICQQQQNTVGSSYSARAAQHSPAMSGGHHQQVDSSSANAMSSEQCNEQDNEDSPNCMQIMKKLFFSFVLGTIIAICWVMIIHTLKWIAIRGNEFELWQLQQQQFQPPGSNYNNPEDIHQANLLLAHQSIQVGQQQHRRQQQQPQLPPTQATDGKLAQGDSIETATFTQPQLYQGGEENERRRRRRRTRRHTQTAGSFYTAESGRNEIKALERRPQRIGPNGHERFEPKTKRDNDASHSSRVSLSTSTTTDRQQANRRMKLTVDDDDDDDGAELGAAGKNSEARNEELPQRKRLMQLSNISREQRRTTNNNNSPADQQHRQRTPQSQANPQAPGPNSHDLSVLAEMDDENDELDSSASSNDLTTIMTKTPLEPQQPMNNGAVPDQSAAAAAMAVLPPGDSDQTPSQHLSTAIERSAAPVNGQVGQVLIYKAPFFTSWFVSIWNIAFMPVFTIISSCCFRNEESTTKKLLAESISQFMDNGLTTFQFLGRCAFFSVLWIGTIFGIVYSLAYLDATVVMALFACSAALVYLLSWVLLHQQFVGVRIVAVIICTTGIALLAYMDNSKTLGSVLIVAGSALCSAVYKVIYQRMFGFWSIAQMSLFFTLIGLFNAFLMWPVALLLYFLGVELIAWRHIPWFHLIAAGALHLTANIVAYFGPICSYDIFLTLGLLFAVVLSAVIDVTFYKITFFGMKLVGVLLLMIGFLVCLLPENWNEYLYDLANERFIRWKKQRSLKKNRNKVQDMSTGQMSRLRTPSGRVK